MSGIPITAALPDFITPLLITAGVMVGAPIAGVILLGIGVAVYYGTKAIYNGIKDLYAAHKETKNQHITARAISLADTSIFIKTSNNKKDQDIHRESSNLNLLFQNRNQNILSAIFNNRQTAFDEEDLT